MAKAKKPGRIKTAIEGLKGSHFAAFMATGALTAVAINPFKPRWKRTLCGTVAAITLYKTGKKLGLKKRNKDGNE
jgi:hypothetical protein